jgi:ribonuclease III
LRLYLGIIRSIFSRDRQFILSLKILLGFTPSNIKLYHLAFLHRSVGTGQRHGLKINNERLEFLGDAVLGAIVAEHLFKKFPFRDEGFLTEMRSKIVNREFLNKISIKIGVNQFISSPAEGQSKSKSIYGDAFEALIGAIYLDKGYSTAREFVIGRIIRMHVDIDELETTELNFKSRLIEWAQREKKTVNFDLIEEVSVKGGKLLKTQVTIDGVLYGTGSDYSKKKSEQTAAEMACQELGLT